MGYNTRYSLTWEEQPNYVDDTIKSYISNQKDSLYYALGSDGESGDECKWYDWFEDMKKMSSEIKNVLFKLHGEGEESGDIWDAYFLNGKGQHHNAKIVIPPFDPNGWGVQKER